MLVIGIGFLIVSVSVFVWFLYRTTKRITAQDMSDKQDVAWREQRRN